MLPLAAPQWITRQAFRIGKALLPPSKKSHLSVHREFQQLCFPQLGPERDCTDEARRWG